MKRSRIYKRVRNDKDYRSIAVDLTRGLTRVGIARKHGVTSADVEFVEYDLLRLKVISEFRHGKSTNAIARSLRFSLHGVEEIIRAAICGGL